MEPIVRDILQLQSGVSYMHRVVRLISNVLLGVEIRVRTSDPPQYEEVLVHGDLCYHIADLIARIKLGGGAGVASEQNFCLYCRTRLSSLSVPAGFTRAGKSTSVETIYLIFDDISCQIFPFETRLRNWIMRSIGGPWTTTRIDNYSLKKPGTDIQSFMRSLAGTQHLARHPILCIYYT